MSVAMPSVGHSRYADDVRVEVCLTLRINILLAPTRSRSVSDIFLALRFEVDL